MTPDKDETITALRHRIAQLEAENDRLYQRQAILMRLAVRNQVENPGNLGAP